jgi:cytochrome c oxidase subunit 1
VYIIVLPGFGIVSEVLPVFSRKPLFGYRFVVFSGAAIGFVGWGVWAHHMFASGLGPGERRRVLGGDDAHRDPDRREDRQLDAHDVGRQAVVHHRDAVRDRPDRRVHHRWSVGRHARHLPSDTQQTDTYYIVAHFHYTIFGGAVLGLFAGFYYWWPKMFGKQLSEKLGKWNFWVMIIGMNLTFGPMHIIGLQGQPRRMMNWTEARAGEGFFNLGFWNTVASVGSLIIAIGVALFIVNVFITHRPGSKTPKAPLDPWDARSLEWITQSPPKEHNFDAIPTVHALDEFFHRKYEVDHDTGRHEGRDRRGDPRRGRGQRRRPHPPAVAVVLADPARRVAADHGLRRDLPALPHRRWCPAGTAVDVRLGDRALGGRRRRLRPAGRRWRAQQGAGDHWLR